MWLWIEIRTHLPSKNRLNFRLAGALTFLCFPWLNMQLYKIRPRKTMPHALLFFVFILMYVVLAINVVLMTLAPQYLMYGNQKYQKKVHTLLTLPKICWFWKGRKTNVTRSTAEMNYPAKNATGVLYKKGMFLQLMYFPRQVYDDTNITHSGNSTVRGNYTTTILDCSTEVSNGMLMPIFLTP